MSITRPTADIAYVVAGGQGGQAVYLDRLVVKGSGGGDYYGLDFISGDKWTVETATPGGGTNQFVNSLDPKIELYDPTGNLVASDNNSGADGRIASLSFIAAVGGPYIVRVLSAAGMGEYVLSALRPVSSVPDTPALSAATDSGASDHDGVTYFNNASPAGAPQFFISGTTPGATVAIYADGLPIGAAVAAGPTTLVTADGQHRLADGEHLITTSQTEPGELPSAVSPPLTIWIDTTDMPAIVTGRHVFYNGSAWDGNDLAANSADDAAIAADKTPLLPGGQISAANCTSYSRGINGIMVDIDALANAGGLTLATFGDYFGLAVSSQAARSGWEPAPAPQQVAVRPRGCQPMRRSTSPACLATPTATLKLVLATWESWPPSMDSQPHGWQATSPAMV